MLFTTEICDISRRESVSYNCKYVLADICDSSGLYVKSIILQINF